MQLANLRIFAQRLLVSLCVLYSALASSTGERTMTLMLISDDFSHQGEIPKLLTCDGENISPNLRWTGIPINAKSLALIVDDPDAPDPAAPKMVWVHWLLYNIPVTATGLAQGLAPKDLPPGALQGGNDWKRNGYGGPCPPIGRHRYFHKLYALDVELPDLHSPNKQQLEKAMTGHIIEQAELVGTYQRK